MHEVSLVGELIDEVSRRLDGRSVELIRIRHASSIPEATLQQAFRLLATGTSLSEAQLETIAFDIRLDCACGFSGSLGHDDVIGGSVTVCPACGDVTTGPRTAEIELLEVRSAG